MECHIMDFMMIYDAYGDVYFLTHLCDSDFLTVTAVCLKAHRYVPWFSSVATVNHPCLFYCPLTLIAKSVGCGVCYKKVRMVCPFLSPFPPRSSLCYLVSCLLLFLSIQCTLSMGHPKKAVPTLSQAHPRCAAAVSNMFVRRVITLS